jgi:hypothetical protein
MMKDISAVDGHNIIVWHKYTVGLSDDLSSSVATLLRDTAATPVQQAKLTADLPSSRPAASTSAAAAAAGAALTAARLLLTR